MLWRNMAAMATEEMLRANPIDGVVLLGGCDKTIPSLLMAAASVDLPAVVVPGGPMLTGTFRGVPLGCGTDVWRLSEEVRAGTLTAEHFIRSESAMIRSRGHCNTMGTASTMALVAEALGTVVPGVAGTPAPDSRLLEAAHGTGRLAVEMVAADRRPSTFLTQASFPNAIVTLAAVGGSTNAVVHLLAIAGRLGIDLTLDDFDRIGSHVPLLVDLQPAGRFLMDDFYRAGGLLAVLREVRDLLDPTAVTVTGRPLVDYLDAAPIWDPEVIRLRRQPLLNEGGIAVLRGNLAPAGAIIKPAAASPHLIQHRGPRSRLRQHRGLPRPHRRPRPRRRCRHRAGAARLRAQGLPRHAGGLEHAAAEETARAGRPRHGAHLRRPDERHCVRNCGAARRPRGRGRRTAGTGADRRRDHPRRTRPNLDARGVGRRSCSAADPTPPPSQASPTPYAAGSGSTSTTYSRPTPAPTSTSLSAPQEIE